LPALPQNLEILYCYKNQLTSLPTLPQNLQILYCFNNELTSLPTLPQNLKKLHCSDNELNYLPTLPQNLETLCWVNNLIYKIVNNDSLFQIKQIIQLLNNFRHLYYCLKFKNQLRKWLWKSKEKEIMEKYHPKYLLENLGDEDDLDTVLNNWN